MSLTRTTIILLGCMATSGCIGYHASKGEYRPGYSELLVGNGTYRVQYNAPGPSRSHLLREGIERRAAELCGGLFTLSDYKYDEQYVMHGDPVHYNFAVATVTCVLP